MALTVTVCTSGVLSELAAPEEPVTDDASEEEPVSPSSPAFFLMNCAAGVSLISVTSTSTQTSGSVRAQETAPPVPLACSLRRSAA